jgi:uncharacterized protein
LATALITGASSGLGEQFAYALARGKYDLVLVARRAKRLEEVAAKARQLGAGQTEIIPADLNDRDRPTAIAQRLDTAQIQVEFLVNNAGFGTAGRFDRMPLARELEEIDVNISALVALTRLFLPAMIVRGRGTIINVSSLAAFQSVPYMATYAATKAFVLSFTEGIANEIVGTGVTVMAFCPGPIKTEFQNVARNEKARVPSFAYQDAEAVVAGAISAAAKGRTVYIPGMLNAAMAQGVRAAPRWLVNRVLRGIYCPVAGE